MSDGSAPLPSLVMTPIGVVRSPYDERASAPRQPYASDACGTIELLPLDGIEHALADLETWTHIWVLFWFHRNAGWRPKVLPPRSAKKVGVFASRAPHRPNPIGMSVVRLERITGLTLHIAGVDMLDGTPVLDIKPYVPAADAHPEASSGWLVRDPDPGYDVVFADRAQAQLDWLDREHALDLRKPICRVLALGPQPHPYRRIRREGDALRVAIKDWRARFRVSGRTIEVLELASGYRPRELATSRAPEIAPHRAFVDRFGRDE